MSEDCLKLTTYFGERDRTDGRLLADALFELYGGRELELSVMLRGIEGFGRHHSNHTELLLSMSEDLPVISVAVDTRERIEALLPEVMGFKRAGLVTLERARLLAGAQAQFDAPRDLPARLQDEIKLTVYVGRHERAGGRPAFVAICELLQRHGLHGATVLLGVDGTRDGARARARFIARNAQVPMMVVSVGEAGAVAAATGELAQLLARPLVTLEQVRVCRRDGVAVGEPRTDAPQLPPAVSEWWQKLTVHSTEDDRLEGHPLHRLLLRELRTLRVAGATSMRGVWGFHDDRPPHGDRLLQLRRHTPVMTIVVDRPQRIAEIYPTVERLTAGSGLVTLESVPVAIAPQAEH